MKGRRQRFAAIAAALACAVAIGAGSGTGLENFDGAARGGLPAGWMSGVTGAGQADWKIVADPSAPSPPNVLKQCGTARYCWCVNTNLSLKNGAVEARFKVVSGWKDKTAGVIWRFQDASNYYAARADALEDSVTIYRLVKGERQEYGSARLNVAANRWHILRVEFSGPHYTVALDNEFALAWDDDTFTNAGPAGVWTKSDSVTCFDDFHWVAAPDRVKE